MDQDKILFLDIETVPLVYQYRDLDVVTKEYGTKNGNTTRRFLLNSNI